MEIGRLAGLARSSFRLQHFLLTYFAFYGLTALFLATLAVALVPCWRHRYRLRHVYGELLARHRSSAALWAWALVALPFVLGFGIAVPQPSRSRSCGVTCQVRRVVFVTLVAMLVVSPVVTRVFDELSLPRARTTRRSTRRALDQEAYDPDRWPRSWARGVAPGQPFGVRRLDGAARPSLRRGARRL